LLPFAFQILLRKRWPAFPGAAQVLNILALYQHKCILNGIVFWFSVKLKIRVLRKSVFPTLSFYLLFRWRRQQMRLWLLPPPPPPPPSDILSLRFQSLLLLLQYTAPPPLLAQWRAGKPAGGVSTGNK
jgi:hypothetical protein